MGAKDWLEALVIPIGLALLPLIWVYFSSRWRRVQFEDLIYREIEEVSPHPILKADAPKHYTNWTNHQPQKRFLHVEILEKPTENRDFIFALRAELVYLVTQLWKSKADAEQWLYFLQEIEQQMPVHRESQRNEIRKVRMRWHKLMKEYGVKFSREIEGAA
jgi:hypothetical protein